MLKKLVLTAATCGALFTATSFVTTSAEARPWHHWRWHHHHCGWFHHHRMCW